MKYLIRKYKAFKEFYRAMVILSKAFDKLVTEQALHDHYHNHPSIHLRTKRK